MQSSLPISAADPTSDVAPLFELDGLGFSVPGRTLLGSLSLTLPARRFVGVIGHELRRSHAETIRRSPRAAGSARIL